jgi:hypothetical protein
MKNKILRLLIEVGFIIFLFYANLVMGEYTQSHLGLRHSFIWALKDVFSIQSFIIAIVSACIGYSIFEYLRKLL